MNIINIKKLFSLLLAFGLFSASVNAAPYMVVNPAVETEATAEQVEVLEFFWYGCPHCYRFEPLLDAWKKKQVAGAVIFKRVPAPLNEQWKTHAQAYYAAEILTEEDPDLFEKIHKGFFVAIHEQGNTLHNTKKLARFFEQYGISAKAFEKAFHSKVVRSKLRDALASAKRYKLTSVPIIAVDGKYLVSAASVGGDMKEVLPTVDALIAKERIRRRSKK